MGFNDHLDEMECYSSDLYVCETCVVDLVLIEIVQSELSSNKCDFCQTKSKNMIAAPFNLVMGRIYESISTEYADAQELNVPWDKGWILEDTPLYDVIGDFDPGWSSEFIEAVQESLGWDKYWVSHCGGDYIGQSPASILKDGWNKFKNQVVYKTRYLFLSEPEENSHFNERDGEIPVSSMLDAIGELAKRLSLIKTIPRGTPLFRVRIAKSGKQFKKFDEVAVPPPKASKAGRLNPAGIPYLYLAFDINTAHKETVYKDVRKIAQATFQTKQELNVLNLVDIPSPPSIFEPFLYRERHETYFLKAFIEDIIKPIEKDGMEHIEYVPTQIISEFFRYRFRYKGNMLLNGIMYPSTKQKGGINLALFISNNEDAKAVLELMKIQM